MFLLLGDIGSARVVGNSSGRITVDLARNEACESTRPWRHSQPSIGKNSGGINVGVDSPPLCTTVVAILTRVGGV